MHATTPLPIVRFEMFCRTHRPPVFVGARSADGWPMPGKRPWGDLANRYKRVLAQSV
jgi:hypothetical protein